MRPAAIESEPELSGRELLQRYGRDPRRPAWADEGRQVSSAAATGKSAERAPRRRHRSVCATCGQTAETTFRPDPARPVYCDGCYQNARSTRRSLATVAS